MFWDTSFSLFLSVVKLRTMPTTHPSHHDILPSTQSHTTEKSLIQVSGGGSLRWIVRDRELVRRAAKTMDRQLMCCGICERREWLQVLRSGQQLGSNSLIVTMYQAPETMSQNE